MKINRITFSIDRNALNEKELEVFNRTTAYYEELIFNFLPGDTEVGGYGFFKTIFDLEIDKPHIKAYGQLIDATRPVSRSKWDSFLNGSVEERVEFLGSQLLHVLADAANQMPVDSENFQVAIKKANEHHNGFEQELKVSKNHKSRRLKVSICRVVKPEEEFIICRIMNKQSGIVDEFVLMENSSVYNASYDFRKSKWNENTLVILNRFDKEKYAIDISKYLKRWKVEGGR